ncbi:melanopsin isoform X1 [Hydra vulgaris]|uniref:melanopsin isoform X1 n=1 Tax=Hydra vulgaris TaxID=6087 RepID=UPI001F5F926D|nr:melanopsin-like [Hydra vulgaris]
MNGTLCNNTSCKDNVMLTLPSDVKFILGVDVFIIFIALVLNIIGISLLFTRKLKNLSPQNIFIMHMSFVSIINIFNNAVAVHWKYQSSRFTKTFVAVYYFAHMAYIINLCLLSLDRFMFVAFPFKYRTKMTNFIVFCSLVLLWLFSIIFGLLIRYGGIANDWFFSNAAYLYNGFVIALAFCIYAYIVIKIHFSSLKNDNQLVNKKAKKLFIMPFLIISSFFMFVFLPHLIAENVKIKSKNTKKLLLLALIGINLLNNVSDPIIYIYLQPDAWKKLVLLTRKFKGLFTFQSFNFLNHKKRAASLTKYQSFEINIETIEP